MRNPPTRRGRLAGFGLALAIACLIAAVVFALSGCARPTTVITFLATSEPSKTHVIIHIDMTFAAGTTQEHMQYPRDFTDTTPLSQHQAAEKGTVTSYRFVVTPVEPGQTVECFTIFDGNAAVPIDHHKATFPKSAVCGGPPV